MEIERDFLLDVFRADDGLKPKSGVRYAMVRLSWVKLLEIKAASELRLQVNGVSKLLLRSYGSVTTDHEVEWQDKCFKPIKGDVRLIEHLSRGQQPSFRRLSLVGFDRASAGIYFWQRINNERIKTPVMAIGELQNLLLTSSTGRVLLTKAFRKAVSANNNPERHALA
jgi:hypothetical protein